MRTVYNNMTMNLSNSSAESTYAINNSPLHQALYVCFFTPVVIVAVLGNSLVVLAVWRDASLRTPRYNILTSLAVTDLLSAAFGITLEVFSRIIQNPITCSTATANYFSVWSYLFAGLSTVHLILVTVDRHLAVTRPLRYLAIVTPRRVAVSILVLWIIGVTYGIISVVMVQGEMDSLTQVCSGELYSESSSRIFFMVTGVTIISLGVVLTIMNARILRVAISSSRNVPGRSRHPSSSSNDGLSASKEVQTQNLKACWTILTVVGMFFLCWLPLALWYLIRTYINISQIAQLLINGITLFCVSLSSAVNPFIYCFKDHLFQHAFCKIIPALEKCFNVSCDH